MKIDTSQREPGVKEKHLCLYHHLGMGDAVECNGMVRHFAEKYDTVTVFAKEIYYDACCFMYRDTPKIKVTNLPGRGHAINASARSFIKGHKGDVLIPGYENFRKIEFKKKGYGPGEGFYHLAGIPWKYRNEKFYVERDLQKEEETFLSLNPKKEKFIFIHDDIRRGFKIKVNTNLKIIRNDPTKDFFSMLGVLSRAKEIHCMSSSFLCLVDCMHEQFRDKKKYLHNTRRVFIGKNTLRSNWVKRGS